MASTWGLRRQGRAAAADTQRPLPLVAKLAQAWPPVRWCDVAVVVAVSGGPDSVALLRGLASLQQSGKRRLLVAHFNHALRRQAERDEQFVVKLARELELECRIGRAAAGAAADEQREGIEAAARRARYSFLEQVAHEAGARYIATAHTADDQAETILHRIVRGTGVAGLAGIPRTRALDAGLAVIRPLLDVRRSEVLDYLTAIEQPYCIDDSNADARFTRNRLRHRLLPLLADAFNPQVNDALLRLGRLAGEAQAVVRQLADALAERAVIAEGADGLEIDRDQLDGQPTCIVREMLVGAWQRQGWRLGAMGLEEWERLAATALSTEPPPRWMLPGGILVEVQSNRVRLSRV